MTSPGWSKTAANVTAGVFGSPDRHPSTDGPLAEWFKRVGLQCHVPQGVTLVNQGAPCHQVFYLEEGWVTLSRSEGTGADMIVAVCRQGAVISVGAALSQRAHPTTAVSRSPARLRNVPVSVLEQAVRDEPTIGRELLRELGRESVAQVARCGALACLRARVRFERLLAELTLSSTAPVRIPLGLQDLAGLVGVDVSHARRLLRQLQADGIVHTSRGGITVQDLQRLRAS